MRRPFRSAVLLLGLLLAAPLHSAEVRELRIESAALGTAVGLIVVLPDGYDGAVPRPVLYLLHGYSGDFRNWTERTDAETLADRHDVILACPGGGYAGWYLDSPERTGSRYERHLIDEVVPFVDGRFATLAVREGRAITGLSMGGHGALILAARHPEVFGAAGSMSGIVDLRPFPDRWGLRDLLGDPEQYPERWADHSAVALWERYDGPPVALIVDTGVEDRLAIDVNRDLHRVLLARDLPHDYIERDGGHTWDYWDNAVVYQGLFFARFFAAHRPR